MFLLLSNAVTLRRDKSILFSRVAILVLLYSFILALNTLYISNLDRGIGLFAGLFHATSTTQNFHIFIFLISAAILQLSGFYPRRLFLYNLRYYRTQIQDKMGEQFKIIEYPLILLFIITGAVFLISSSDLVSIFLSIELQSYGLYLLSTIYRNSELATRAGLTYFLLGGLSTSLLYANSGTTNLDGIYVVTSISDLANAITPHGATDLAKELNPVLDGYKSDYINISLLILSVGFLFKYSISNLNAFIILISIGFSLFYYENKTEEYKELSHAYFVKAEKEYSPIQLISQLKGYFYINPVLALSLTITIFSFVGIPPLIGFFAKQMVLSAALDSGYVFMALVAILTSVISAVYYLNIIKQVFFDQPDYQINDEIRNLKLEGNISLAAADGVVRHDFLAAGGDENPDISSAVKKFTFKVDSIILSSSLTITISTLSMIILLFMFMPEE
ncbi:hypothetical protein HYFRA_00013648 [Hymenoscyphus fraxineus]|uniref:NADH-ubiquinone oxidoreductase chain 2 n=1 Tax=Hymenoscyphus fraxineus TaxID=746836 RepID=A0A9N9L8R7_9HELO|nr:hypothetical protein HYFRA_00013648 [Hymenoscyphus fraxineus]